MNNWYWFLESNWIDFIVPNKQSPSLHRTVYLIVFSSFFLQKLAIIEWLFNRELTSVKKPSINFASTVNWKRIIYRFIQDWQIICDKPCNFDTFFLGTHKARLHNLTRGKKKKKFPSSARILSTYPAPIPPGST